MKRNDWLLAAAIVVAAVLILCVQLFRGTSEDAFVSVTVDGELFGTYRLDQDQTVSVNDTNRLVIRDRTARMEWASCPDQICVYHREISREGESIICLPNQVVVSVESPDKSGLDGISQ